MSDQTPTPSRTWMLLAVIAVDKTERVQCECNGCGQGIYAAIHMVELPNAEIQCWGSNCYAREVGLACTSHLKPLFPGVNGRRLTDTEREQLRINRQQLVANFKAEFEDEQRRVDQARVAAATWEAKASTRRGGWDRPSETHVIVPAPDEAPVMETSESKRSVYDLPPRTCVLCGELTSEWWTNIGPDGCKCKACLKAGKS